MTTVLRAPKGLPSLAGKNFTVILSPLCRAFGPVLPIPRCARAVAEPSVSTQLVVEPAGFVTATVKEPWGLTNLTLSTAPESSISFFMSYTPASECGASSEPAVRHAHDTNQNSVHVTI